jgi:hypothetical protein
LGRSSRKGLVSRSESIYPFCLYLRSLSIGKNCSVFSWTLSVENKDPWHLSSKDRRNRNAFAEAPCGDSWRWDHSEACGKSEAHRSNRFGNPLLLPITCLPRNSPDCTP